MERTLLLGLGLALAMNAGCSKSSSDLGEAQIVAGDDGAVEVIVRGKTLFALAATGPVARNFTERAVGIGTSRSSAPRKSPTLWPCNP